MKLSELKRAQRGYLDQLATLQKMDDIPHEWIAKAEAQVRVISDAIERVKEWRR